MERFKGLHISVNYLRNKYMIEDLRQYITNKEYLYEEIKPLDYSEIYGYEKGFNRAAEIFNKTVSESNQLMDFLSFVELSTNWKNNKGLTNEDVVREYMKHKYDYNK